MNWNKRVERANKAKAFTSEDKELASLWVTSPISEFADKVELKHGKLCRGPIDIFLVLDGLYFTKGVEDNDIQLATNCYNAIVKQVEALGNGTDHTTTIKRFLGEI